MRKLILATASLIAFAGAAQAQTLFAGPDPVWTGPYLGVVGGGGWGSSRHTDGTGFNSGRFSTNGGEVGGTLGYNWEMPNHIVLGAETDLSWAGIGGSTGGGGACGGSPAYCSTKLNGPFGTVRGRVGYAMGRFLPYATAGLAYGNIYGREGDVPANGAFGSGKSMELGWTAGGGLEAAIAPRWSGKLEYLYTDFGSNHVFNDGVPGGGVVPENVNFHAHLLRVGLNYQF